MNEYRKGGRVVIVLLKNQKDSTPNRINHIRITFTKQFGNNWEENYRNITLYLSGWMMKNKKCQAFLDCGFPGRMLLCQYTQKCSINLSSKFLRKHRTINQCYYFTMRQIALLTQITTTAFVHGFVVPSIYRCHLAPSFRPMTCAIKPLMVDSSKFCWQKYFLRLNSLAISLLLFVISMFCIFPRNVLLPTFQNLLRTLPVTIF
jgi:hypothetical protein